MNASHLQLVIGCLIVWFFLLSPIIDGVTSPASRRKLSDFLQNNGGIGFAAFMMVTLTMAVLAAGGVVLIRGALQ